MYCMHSSRRSYFVLVLSRPVFSLFPKSPFLFPQCFCGSADDALDAEEGTCTMKCAGDDAATCGGSDAINVYEL